MNVNLQLESEHEKAIKRAIRKERVGGDLADLFNEPAPKELLTPYEVDYKGQRRMRRLQQKYMIRKRNIKRAWNRVQLYLPELIEADTPHSIFEMSTAHGAVLEVLRHFGHDVLGNDYANMVREKDDQGRSLFRGLNDDSFKRDRDDYGIPMVEADGDAPDWPYRPIIESINIPMNIFDGGHIPYPLDDKQVDVTICLQAIEHYCHPKDWMPIVDEFCRISRKTVLVMLNRMLPSLEEDPGYKADFNAFRLGMRRFNQNGFHCTGCFMHYGGVHVFKLTAK